MVEQLGCVLYLGARVSLESALCVELVCKSMSTGELHEKGSGDSGKCLPGKLCSESCVV